MQTAKPKLPHQSAGLYLTDGGLETTLIFLEGIELPFFAAFDLLKEEAAYHYMERYYRSYLDIAKEFKTSFILESPTWRASPDWLEKLGYHASETAQVNKKAIALMMALQEAYQYDIPHILISGCIGPRGDGYRADNQMTVEEAAAYHAVQIEAFSRTPVDMVSAMTINYVEEAMGIAQAAQASHLPVVISFTVETDGKLPSGMRLQEAIEQVDNSTTAKPIYYMINCAHPTHFRAELEKGSGQQWVQRIRGIRANASCKSHAELDESVELDRGNLQELAQAYQQLKSNFEHLNVFGGCCGTDAEHIQTLARALMPAEV